MWLWTSRHSIYNSTRIYRHFYTLSNISANCTPNSLSLNFCIFPLAVFGNPSTQNTHFGTKCLLSLSFTQSLTPSSVTSLCSFLTTKAATDSPYFSSGRPTTEMSATPGCARITFSISSGWMFSPPRIIKSLIRPVIRT
jgi:hypothetical protein